MSVVEERYQAQMAVLAGDPVTEVAAGQGRSVPSESACLAAPLCRRRPGRSADAAKTAPRPGM